MFSNIHLRVYSVRVLCMGLMYMSVNHFTFKTCRHIVIQDEAPYLYALFFISACLNKEWLMAALIFLACCWCCMTAWCYSCKTKATSPLKKTKTNIDDMERQSFLYFYTFCPLLHCCWCIHTLFNCPLGNILFTIVIFYISYTSYFYPSHCFPLMLHITWGWHNCSFIVLVFVFHGQWMFSLYCCSFTPLHTIWWYFGVLFCVFPTLIFKEPPAICLQEMISSLTVIHL